MLLGFVNQAVDYLNKHMDDQLDSSLTELKNIDLESLKKQLDEELNGSVSSTVESLLNAGSDAFEKFIDRNKSESLSSEFDRIFDVSLDDEKPAEEKDSLQDLLSMYHMDSAPETKKEDTPEQEEEKAELKQEEEKEELKQEEEKEEPNQEEQEEETTYELTEEESKLLQMIANNVNRKPDDRQEDVLSGANKELDSIFSELVEAEDEVLKNSEAEEKAKTDIEKPVTVVPEKIDGEAYGYIENPLVDMNIPDPDLNLVFPEQVEKNDIIQLIKDIQPLSDAYYNRVESLIDLQEKEEAQKKNEGKQESRYVSSLIDDLKAKMSKEDEDKREEEEAYRQVYESIRKTYPYLSNGFIRNVYELKESIASEYPEEENIIILHRTVFRNVENLRQYVEIALKHGYLINADEKKMIVDVMKAYVNSDGKIITSIFEVANQSALLNGEYEGYRVLFEDDL
jgi:hypothetical protein